MERGEVDVVAGVLADAFEERSVDPVYDGAVHLAGAAEGFLVFLEIANENILHLQVTAGVQQRQGLQETLQRAGAEVETEILGGGGENAFDHGEVDACGERASPAWFRR